jgi:hypothetical protein
VRSVKARFLVNASHGHDLLRGKEKSDVGSIITLTSVGRMTGISAPSSRGRTLWQDPRAAPRSALSGPAAVVKTTTVAAMCSQSATASMAHVLDACARRGAVEQDAPAVEVGRAAAGELGRDGGEEVARQGHVGALLAEDTPHLCHHRAHAQADPI